MPKSNKTGKNLTSGPRKKSEKADSAKISQIEVEDKTADMLEDITGFEIHDNLDLRARYPGGLEMNDNVIKGLKDPIEHKYFTECSAVVDENNLARSKNVRGLSDAIWAGIPDVNKKY
jgi:hypothetical protein